MSDRWKQAWQDLYLERLDQPEHEERRDAMFAWALEHGQHDACMAGLSSSVPFPRRQDEHPADTIERARVAA